MLGLFLFFFFSRESVNGGLSGAQPLDEVRFTISKILPHQIPYNGGINVELHVDPPHSGGCFCRFGDQSNGIIVNGNGESDGTVICEAPNLHQSHMATAADKNDGNGNLNGNEILVFFSVDSKSWSDGYPVELVRNGNTLWIIVGIVGFTCLASFVLFWWQMRQCKNASKRNRENPQAFADNGIDYDDGEDFQPLKRNSPHLL